MGIDISDELRRRVSERAYRVCEYCLVHEADLLHACEVDHIIGMKYGGQTEFDNLANACFHCNRHKGSDLGSLAPPKHKLIRFFNPRADRWADHFHIDAGRIVPLSEIGEVTARILEFNHPDRVLLRRLLADQGRYPTIEALARMKE